MQMQRGWGLVVGAGLAIVVAVGCWSLHAQGKEAAAPAARTTSRPAFLISHWSIPQGKERLEAFTQAGFNTILVEPADLPACRQHGWQALLAVPADRAAKYAADPAVWGYFLLDEPARKHIAYDTLAPQFAAFHRLDPARPAYVNLNEEDDPAAFIQAVRPRVLSYDYYQWWAGNEPFFPLLEKFRSAAVKANIPLLCWVEASAARRGPIGADNEGRIRHSVFSALAYGAKGIQWWYWRPENRDVQRINAELKLLGPELVNLHSVDVFHTGPLSRDTRPIPAECWVQSPTESLLLGLMQNDHGDDYLLVANKDWKAARTATLKFAQSVSAVAMLNKKTGGWVDLSLSPLGEKQALSVAGANRTLSRELAAGDGMLLRVTRAAK